jgi:hypothetical protein
MLEYIRTIIRNNWNKKTVTLIVIILIVILIQNTILDIHKLNKVEEIDISSLIAYQIFAVYQNLSQIATSKENIISFNVFSNLIYNFDLTIKNMDDEKKKQAIETFYKENKIALYLFSQTIDQSNALLNLIITSNKNQENNKKIEEGSHYMSIIKPYKNRLEIITTYNKIEELDKDLKKFKTAVETFTNSSTVDVEKYVSMATYNNKQMTFFIMIK